MANRLGSTAEATRTFLLAAYLSPRMSPAPPRRARLAVTRCFFGNALLFSTWVSRIPAVREKLGLTPPALGLSLLALAAGATGAMPVAGWACGRFGSRRVTAVTALASCTVLPLLALAPDRFSLTLVMCLFGAVHGGFDVSMNAQAVAVEARYARPIMSSFHALWSTGALAGALLGGAIAAAGWTTPVHFAAAAVVIGAGLLGTVPGLLPGEPAPPRGAAARLSLLRLPRRLLSLGAIAFCVMMGEGAMADWSAIFLRDATGASEALAPAGYAAVSVAMALGRFSGDRLNSRLGALTLLRFSGCLAAGGLALALGLARTGPALAGFVAVGAGFATVVPLVFSAAGRLRGVEPGAALGAVTTLGYTGFLIGPPVIGFLAGHAGVRVGLCFVVLTSSLVVGLAGQVAEEPKTGPPSPLAGSPLEELT